jgi:hypothetical protein
MNNTQTKPETDPPKIELQDNVPKNKVVKKKSKKSNKKKNKDEGGKMNKTIRKVKKK